MSSPSTPLDRRILSLALPALGALAAEPLFVLIDSAMVGHLGAVSLAGLSLASSVLTTLVGLFVFLAYATTATTARLFGAGQRQAGLRAGLDGIWLALALGVLAGSLLAAAAPWVVAVLGGQGAVAVSAVAYLRASAAGVPGMLVVLAATGTLRGLLDTRTPFVVATAGAVLNVALNALLLYGLGLGIAGSGLGTALAQTLMAAALLTPLVRTARAAGVSLRPSGTGLGSSLGAGAPLLVRTVSLRAAILATVWAATSLGETPLAAHQVVSTVWGLAAFSLDALAVAAQALVGNALGAAAAAQETATASPPDSAPDSARGRAAETDRAGTGLHPPLDQAGVDTVLRRCLSWGVGAGAVLGAVVAAASPWLPLLFTTDAGVVAAARPALLVAASALPLAGAVFLYDGVLMGAGDGPYLARVGVLTLLPYLPTAYAVAHGAPAGGGAGLLWLWCAFAWLFMGARAVTTGLRARSETWRH